MSRTVYVNGTYLPEEDAKVSIFDRSFLMADGVYEVTSVLGGKLIDFDGHLARLERWTEREQDERTEEALAQLQRDVLLFLVEEHMSRHILEQIATVGDFDNSPGTGIAFQIDVEDAVGVSHQASALVSQIEEEL